MEEKARLYAAMKRGDVEDRDEKYAVDFDRKWAEGGEGADHETSSDDDDDDSEGEQEMVEYMDEFGRPRTGTRAKAEREERRKISMRDEPDRFTARPAAPSNVIYGDTIQTAAFNPDEPIAAQMEELARKRDKSLTPPPDSHFDASKEVRTKGTGFFQFSGDAEERKRQMEGLEREREETERRRKEREGKLSERKKVIEARRAEIERKRGKRKAEDFLDDLGVELGGKVNDGGGGGSEMTEKIEAAIEKEVDD